VVFTWRTDFDPPGDCLADADNHSCTKSKKGKQWLPETALNRDASGLPVQAYSKGIAVTAEGGQGTKGGTDTGSRPKRYQYWDSGL
jgi:hypothetical protein